MNDLPPAKARKTYTDGYVRSDAERAIRTALLAFAERRPTRFQVEHLDDAINALIERNHGIAFVLAMGAVVHAHRGSEPADGDSLERLARAFEAAQSWLDSQSE
jgi:hypothetical protein